MFEDRKIKGVTPLWAAQAAKQLVIRVKHRKISVLILIAYKLKCVTQCKRSVGRTFAHSIFEAAALQTGFHGTHGTPSGSATVSYVRKNTLLAAKGGCISPPGSATAKGKGGLVNIVQHFCTSKGFWWQNLNLIG